MTVITVIDAEVWELFDGKGYVVLGFNQNKSNVIKCLALNSSNEITIVPKNYSLAPSIPLPSPLYIKPNPNRLLAINIPCMSDCPENIEAKYFSLSGKHGNMQVCVQLNINGKDYLFK